MRFEDGGWRLRAAEVMRSQGLPPPEELPREVCEELEAALSLYERSAEPVGVFEEVDWERVAEVYAGGRANAPRTPLAEVLPRARHFALFAATVGEAVTGEIGRLFAEGDLARAYFLDVIAAAGAERLSTALAGRLASSLRERGACAADAWSEASKPRAPT